MADDEGNFPRKKSRKFQILGVSKLKFTVRKVVWLGVLKQPFYLSDEFNCQLDLEQQGFQL